MNTTIRHISHLLQEHDSVAVPGLGVFRRSYRSSYVAGDSLMPPGNEVVFIADETTDDGMLRMSIARCLACEPATAAQRIAEDVAEMKSRIQAGQSIAIGSIGTLSVSTDFGGVTFVNNADKCCNAMSWLSPVSLLAAEPAAAAPEESSIDEEKRNIFLRSLQRTASSAAVLALLVLVAFVASQLPKRQNHVSQAASFTLESLEAPVAEPLLSEPVAEKTLVLILNTPSDGMSIVDPTEKQYQAEAEPNLLPDSYYLVVASLANADDARKFIAAYPETLGLKLLEKDGRCRVYAASGQSFAGTKAAADSRGLFELFPSAWICHN